MIELGRMQPAQPLNSRGIDMIARLAQEHVGEETTAHADLAMDAPDGKVDPLALSSAVRHARTC